MRWGEGLSTRSRSSFKMPCRRFTSVASTSSPGAAKGTQAGLSLTLPHPRPFLSTRSMVRVVLSPNFMCRKNLKEFLMVSVFYDRLPPIQAESPFGAYFAPLRAPCPFSNHVPMARELVLVLDNIRSLHNVGSMLRSADGFGVKKVILCGITGTPDRHAAQKVALGAEKSVPWERAAKTWSVVEQLKNEGYSVIGLERCKGALPIGKFRPPRKVAVVVGNEVTGITPSLRRRIDAIAQIPMRGMKESYNVAVACGVALYAFSR